MGLVGSASRKRERTIQSTPMGPSPSGDTRTTPASPGRSYSISQMGCLVRPRRLYSAV